MRRSARRMICSLSFIVLSADGVGTLGEGTPRCAERTRVVPAMSALFIARSRLAAGDMLGLGGDVMFALVVVLPPGSRAGWL